MRMHGWRWFSASYAITMLCAFLIATAAFLLAPLPVCIVGGRTDIGCARGFQTREGDQRPFRWSDDQAWITLPGVSWSGPQALSITLAAPRPQGLAQPIVTVAVADLVATFSAPAVTRRYLLVIPPASPATGALSIRISSETFVPPGDERDLGVAISEARVLPTTALRLPGLMPAVALVIIAAALSRLLELARTPGQPVVSRAGAAHLAGLLIATLLAALSVVMPMQVAPFIPGLAAILALAAWVLPRLGLSRMPYPIWVAACGGAALDALLITDLVRGHWVVVALAVQAILVVWGVAAALKASLAIGTLLEVALFVRLLAFAARLLSGNAGIDPDTELFYNYGRATIELGVPIAEYPSGALMIWALLSVPASRELFALFLPLLNLACDLAIVWGIATIAHANEPLDTSGNDVRMTALAACYAITPLLLHFWHGKYDALPAALMVVGLALFSTRRFGWSGAMLGLGGAIKWAPWLAIPMLCWQLVGTILGQQPRHEVARGQRRWPIAHFLLGLALAILTSSLPFALRDWQGFLTPYTVQGARPLIGESVWFLPAALFEPQLLNTLTAPWSGTESNLITPIVTLAAQAFALLVLALIVMLRPIEPRRTLALSALGPATFLLLNRVYSPQYALPISASLLIAGAAVLRTRRDVIILAAALAVMQAANLLVWPYTKSYWLIPSAIQFAAGIGATIWLAWCASCELE